MDDSGLFFRQLRRIIFVPRQPADAATRIGAPLPQLP